MNFWNKRNLPVPPINTYKTTNKNIDIQHLYNVLWEGKGFFDDSKYMSAEYAVLSRIVYRMKQKFRTAKDFKALEKVNKALDNYFDVGISSNIKKFIDLIPSRYKDETYLPTKNLLDYILVRLQGLAKLMERIVETSKIAGYLLEKRMNTGHFWKIAFIIFSLISRIYVLAKYTAKFICEFYRKLLPFSHQLQNTGRQWLPQDYALPKDLKEWMNVDWLEFDDEVQIVEISTEIPDIIQFFDLVNDDDDVEFCDEYFLINDDDAETVKEFKKICNSKSKSVYSDNFGELRGFDNREDIGEIVEINDSLLDEQHNTEDVSDISEINIVRSDTGKGDIITILDNTSQSELEVNSDVNGRSNSPPHFDKYIHEPVPISRHNSYITLSETDQETDEEAIINISDISVLEATNSDDKNEANNDFESNKNTSTKNKERGLMSDNFVNISNSLFIPDSECEAIVIETDEEHTEATSESSVIEIQDIGEVKKKKKLNKFKNHGTLKGNLKLLQKESRTNQRNINASYLLNSDVESNNVVTKNSNENLMASNISLMQVPNVSLVKKKKKPKKKLKKNRNNLRETENKGTDDTNRSTNGVVLSRKNSNSVIETDGGVITVSDTSLIETFQERVMKKKKKLEKSIKKCDKLLTDTRNKVYSSSVNSPTVSSPTRFTVITDSHKKNVANEFLRNYTGIKQKRKRLKHKIKHTGVLENNINNNKTKADNESLNENPGDTVTREQENGRIKKIKIKDNLQNSNTELISDVSLKEKTLEMTDKIWKKKKNKLWKNGGNDTKPIKNYGASNENVVNESSKSIRSGHIKIKKNKSKKETKNIKQKNNVCRSNSGHIKVNADILSKSQTRTYKKGGKFEENGMLNGFSLKSINGGLKNQVEENNKECVKNKKNRLSYVTFLDNRKSLKSSESLYESQLSEKSTESRSEVNSVSNIQNKVMKKLEPNKNYKGQSSTLWTSTPINSSRKRKIDVEVFHELDSYLGNENNSANTKKKLKKIKRTENFDKSQLSKDLAESRGEINVTLNLHNNVTRKHKPNNYKNQSSPVNNSGNRKRGAEDLRELDNSMRNENVIKKKKLKKIKQAKLLPNDSVKRGSNSQ